MNINKSFVLIGFALTVGFASAQTMVTAPVATQAAKAGSAKPVRMARPGIPTAPGWFEELPPAIEQAKKTGKDILIDFGGSNWCLPCMLLKQKIFTSSKFYSKASPSLVLVDIDTLTEDAMPKDKLARYIALQKKYSVGSFPSVFLCTPDGEAYAWTTYIPSITTPEAYWAHLEPYLRSGALFREGMRKAEGLQGAAKAAAMVDALSQIRADFVWRYHADRIAQIRKLDPSDKTGFLAYLDGRRAYDRFVLTLNYPEAGKAYDHFIQSLNGLQGNAFMDAFKKGGGDRLNPFAINPKVTIADVDGLVAKYKLSGETLQQAMLIKAVIYVDNDRPADAVQCFKDVLAEDSNRGRFDTGQYFSLDPESKQAMETTLDACSAGSDKASLYVALQRVFESQLPDRYQLDCHATQDQDFRPAIAVRIPVKWLFEQAVQQKCSALDGEAKSDYQRRMEAEMKAEDDAEMAQLTRDSKG